MAERQHRLILSPCGTSLLTHGCNDDERKLLNRHTNTKTIDETGADRIALETRIASVATSLSSANAEIAARKSAELNGILTLNKEDPAPCRDHHILLCTDTWLGEQTGKIVEDWLRRNTTSTIELRRQKDLQTSNLPYFQFALSELVQWLDSTIEGYREQQYRVVFNLTGGFKSVQGFLQTLGNLYADETIYIFESASALLRIPRLPVRMDALDTIRDHLRVICRLANGLSVVASELVKVPETFLLRLDGQTTLSPWGSVVWEQSRKELYTREVWPVPSDKVRFAASFLPSTRGLASDRLLNLNDKFEKLAVFLEGENRKSLKSLDLKSLKGNPKPPSTHELDAWADGDAKRVFCHYEGDVLVLDRLDAALH